MTFLARSARRSCKLPPGAARRTSRASVHFGTTPPHKTHGLHPSFSPQGTTALDMYRYDDARPFFNGDTQGIASYRFAPHSIASLLSHRIAALVASSHHPIVASWHCRIIASSHHCIVTSSHGHIVSSSNRLIITLSPGWEAGRTRGGPAVARRCCLPMICS